MSDENIDDITSNVANAAPSLESAEAVTPVEVVAPVEEINAVEVVSSAVAEEHVVPDLPLTATIEPISIPEENRGERRIHVRWHVDVLIEGHIWQGFVKEISIGGASIFLEHNCHKTKNVKLHIHVPPNKKSSSHHVLDISAKINISVYDCGETLFRSNVKFLKFNLDSDSAYLLSCIANH